MTKMTRKLPDSEICYNSIVKAEKSDFTHGIGLFENKDKMAALRMEDKTVALIAAKGEEYYYLLANDNKYKVRGKKN